MSYINGGGMDLEWAKDLLFHDITSDTFNFINQEIEKLEPSNIIFIPHLKGRSCPNQPYLRGVWAGFSWEHKREHLFRAILEGIAFEYAYYLKIIKELFPEISFSEVRVIGGGAKSSIWNTIKASILNIPYAELDREECAIWSSALIGGYAVGLFKDLAQKAKNSVKITKIYTPKEGLYSFYQKLFPLYVDTLEAMRTVFMKHKILL
jgi:xylulokinase